MLELRQSKTAPLLSGDLAIIKQCLDDGWPFSEIAETYGYTQNAVRRHFPGKGMPVKEAAALGWLVRKFNQGTLKGKIST